MIYIDCGYYMGMAFEKYIKDAPGGWTIYAFEPNLEIEVPKGVRRKAVWIKDGEMQFQISGRKDAAALKGESSHPDGSKEITVKTIDFSKFVGKLPNDYIICSMDIEGAEFPVLEKMIKDGTIDKINELDIEFHHRLRLDKNPEDSQELIDKITERGVKVTLKVPLI